MHANTYPEMHVYKHTRTCRQGPYLPPFTHAYRNSPRKQGSYGAVPCVPRAVCLDCSTGSWKTRGHTPAMMLSRGPSGASSSPKTFHSDYFFSENRDDPCNTLTAASSRCEKREEVGPFVLGPVLGQGCTGIVRLGTHKTTGFKVAFKIMKKKYINSKRNLWAKVKREIAILKLIEHPHVLKLYDVYETHSLLYIVLENVSLPATGTHMHTHIHQHHHHHRPRCAHGCACVGDWR